MADRDYRVLCSHPESECKYFEYFSAVMGLCISIEVEVIGEFEQKLVRKDKIGSILFEGDIIIHENNHGAHGVDSSYTDTYTIRFYKDELLPFSEIDLYEDSKGCTENVRKIGNKYGIEEEKRC